MGTRMAKFDSILGTVANTPIVRINNLTPRTDVNFYVKIEAFNPLGSVKDRLALGRDRSGRLFGLAREERTLCVRLTEMKRMGS
jgi:cysteine synthase A